MAREDTMGWLAKRDIWWVDWAIASPAETEALTKLIGRRVLVLQPIHKEDIGTRSERDAEAFEARRGMAEAFRNGEE